MKTILLTSTFVLGWFARDPVILSKVGHVLLQLPHVDPVKPSQFIIAEDSFQLSTVPSNRVAGVLVKSVEKLYGGKRLDHITLSKSNSGYLINTHHSYLVFKYATADFNCYF